MVVVAFRNVLSAPLTIWVFELIGTWLGQDFGSYGTRELGLGLDNSF